MDRTGRMHATKVPVSVRTGRNARSTNAAPWAPFGAAVVHARQHALEIGYVFAADDPFCGIDLDGFRDPQTGSITAWARGELRLLDSYAEVSPSGTGVKVFLCGALAHAGGKRRGPTGITRWLTRPTGSA